MDLNCVVGDVRRVEHPLGIVLHTTPEPDDVTSVVVDLPKTPLVRLPDVLDPAQSFAEVWTTGRPVESGEFDDVVFGHDGEYVFCAVRVPSADKYASVVRDAYLSALYAVADLGYPHIFRIWNTVSRINGRTADGLEIHQEFCRGRAEAFDLSPVRLASLPAGTEVGGHGDGLSLYLLSRRTEPHVAIENPQQTPAYRYPTQYGLRPPAFARAARNGDQLYVSGTAAILGHETVHPGDVVAQCRTTVDNLSTLLSSQDADLSVLRTVKVYVRHESDLAVVRDQCRQHFAPDTRIVYLVVDLCRSDLLVEIEAVGQL
ncbi:FkbO/Hyg5 family chorismatase [Kribbella sp. NPDC056861]|uniref:FkbO/Hyg5 family chorismatase n=1 Tax=Kribbella sp. NPDC056861 TaxID=3154857 RepID=UPI0034375CDA